MMYAARLSLTHSLIGLVVFFTCLLGPGMLMAQSCSIPGNTGATTLSTAPNSYFPGSTNAAINATSITLGARTGAAVDIVPGDLVLIIQMQGAVINTTNTNQYGDGVGSGTGATTATLANNVDPARGSVSNTAGTYEFAIATNTVTAAGGTLNLSAPLQNAFVTSTIANTAPTGSGVSRYQVIRVPQYSSLTLSGTINVLPWNGSTGGVFVIDVAGSLALGGATVNAAQRGFRGGGSQTQTATCTAAGGTQPCTDFRLPNANPADGAFKGEGIAGSPAFMYDSISNSTVGSFTGADGYPGGDRSRGAPGNAGGGGNQHNSGGGGGGNGGIGGFGGNTWNASNSVFEGGRFGGFGGANGYNSANRIVMGGGGGAGDTNNAGTAHGGSGGGIVMIRAGTVTGNGTINANGANGVGAGLGTDAAGGGGAGGTIWITTGDATLPGTLVMSANGGAGANSGPMGGGNETDGPGGGGGGGVLITNASTANFTANGGAFGVMTNSGSDVCGNFAPSTNPQCFATAGGIGNTVTVAVPVANTGVRLGHECLPDLRVTKSTTTPSISASGATTAQYTINIQNFGGGARNVVVEDPSLPVAPNWTRNATAPSYAYSPPSPIAANNLPAGAEASNTDGGASFALVATPGTVPASGSNALTWRQFFLPPIKNGVPSQATITFVADIPAAASVGCYQNAAGIRFLDSTRLAASATRMITPATNNSANRTAVAYSANSTYASGFTSTIAGNNYSGLPSGPAGEDVCLLGDLSVSKSAPASVTAGQTLTYALVASNLGRQIRDIDFSTHQATTATNAVTPSAILTSGRLRITDTLPASLTVTTAFSGAGWSCVQTGQDLTCDRTSAVPVTASVVIGTVTGTVRVSNTACTGPLVNTVTLAGLQSPYTETSVVNNSASASTTLNCEAALSITKTNTVTSLIAGGTTSYLIQATNTGPSSADGALMRDTPTAGLSGCAVTTCSASGGTPVASCPLPAQWPNLLTPGGVAIPSFPSGGTVRFTVTCNVTATGLP